MEKIVLAVHGGAGTILPTQMTPEKEKAYLNGLEQALQSGFKILQSGGSSVDAVEAAVTSLENNPLFNAGKGAVFTHNGKHELDASIMEGKNLKAGAVSGITRFANPVHVARLVMDKSAHVLLSSLGAEQFALSQGLEPVDNEYFFTEERWNQLQEAIASGDITLDHSGKSDNKFGTVGAVALDLESNLAAATSTGGMTNKMFGRVGDTPIIGAGTYANNETCAISCTGHGENFIRALAAFEVHARMFYLKESVTNSSNFVVQNKLVQMGGEGGLIALDKNGIVSMPFNSEGMYRGYITESGTCTLKIYK
jgi:beta-aspartyl-peptidase (threonine type)